MLEIHNFNLAFYLAFIPKYSNNVTIVTYFMIQFMGGVYACVQTKYTLQCRVYM